MGPILANFSGWKLSDTWVTGLPGLRVSKEVWEAWGNLGTWSKEKIHPSLHSPVEVMGFQRKVSRMCTRVPVCISHDYKTWSFIMCWRTGKLVAKQAESSCLQLREDNSISPNLNLNIHKTGDNKLESLWINRSITLDINLLMYKMYASRSSPQDYWG